MQAAVIQALLIDAYHMAAHETFMLCTVLSRRRCLGAPVSSNSAAAARRHQKMWAFRIATILRGIGPEGRAAIARRPRGDKLLPWGDDDVEAWNRGNAGGSNFPMSLTSKVSA